MSTASRRRAPSLLLGGAGFCVNISWQVVLPILSLYLAHVGFSLAGIGLVVGVFSLSMGVVELNRKSTRLNSSHSQISYAVFCLKKKKQAIVSTTQPHPSHRIPSSSPGACAAPRRR